TGEGRGISPGEVHDIALKAAETDATKRALATFGKPFGLALYGTAKIAFSAKALGHEPKPIESGRQNNFARDDTTPIPRPSRYYGRRQDPVARDLASRQRIQGSAPAPERTCSGTVAATNSLITASIRARSRVIWGISQSSIIKNLFR